MLVNVSTRYALCTMHMQYGDVRLKNEKKIKHHHRYHHHRHRHRHHRPERSFVIATFICAHNAPECVCVIHRFAAIAVVIIATTTNISLINKVIFDTLSDEYVIVMAA